MLCETITPGHTAYYTTTLATVGRELLKRSPGHTAYTTPATVGRELARSHGRTERGRGSREYYANIERLFTIKYSCKANLATVVPAAVQADRWPALYPSPYRRPRAGGYP